MSATACLSTVFDGAATNALGVLGGEALATTRRAGLVEHRRALRRRFAEMDAGYLEVLADMADLVNLARVAEDPSATVAEHRAVLPTAFEELVEHLWVFVGIVVAAVVVELGLLAEVARAAFQVGGHYVPADPALGQVVQGRESAGEG